MQLTRWLRRLALWLAEPKPLWLLLSVLCLFTVIPLVRGAAESELRLSGLILQLLGVGTVARGLRQTRRLFGQPPEGRQLQGWLRRFPLWRGRTFSAGATITGIGRAEARPHVWTDMDRDAPRAELLGAMMQNIERLRQRVLDLEARSADAHRAVTRALEDEREARSTSDTEIRAKLEAAQTGGISISFVGLAWLFAGLVMATLSSEIARVLG